MNLKMPISTRIYTKKKTVLVKAVIVINFEI